MEEYDIKATYYVPGKRKSGGNFYYKLVCYGDIVPNDLSEYIKEDVPYDELPEYLKQYGILVYKTGAEITKLPVNITPYIAFKKMGLEDNIKVDTINSYVDIIKSYYNYVCKNQEDIYNKRKKLK